MNKKYTKYTEEELNRIKEEYTNTNILLKEIRKKYNLGPKLIKEHFSNLKSPFRKLYDRPQEEWDKIIEYYKTNETSYEEMKKLFNLTDHQCNHYLSFTKGNTKPKKYDIKTDEEWNQIIEYYKDNDVSYNEIKEKFNVSMGECVKRLKEYKPDKHRVQVNVGDKFGMLTVIDVNRPNFISRGGGVRRMVKVKCDCGNELDLRLHDIRRGSNKSCGCWRSKSHGDTYYAKGGTEAGKRTYITYISMKRRCLNKSNHNYPTYGGRGITICEQWLDPINGYNNFKEYMGERPEGTTLDRIDPNGNYEPGNVRWADPKTQTRNQRRYIGKVWED